MVERAVAALYVDRLGVYPRMSLCGCFDRKAPGHVCEFSSQIDCWDESRDAKLYNGPHPVVAHPPCGPWSRLRHLCTRQDATCGPRAFAQVRQFGGVLEHPELSRLWDYVGAPKPGDATDAHGGRTYLVRQVDRGHSCEKSTWLYIVGVEQLRVMRNIRARRGSGVATHCVSRDAQRARRNEYSLLRSSSAAARRTPPAFAEWLVKLARASEVKRG